MSDSTYVSSSQEAEKSLIGREISTDQKIDLDQQQFDEIIEQLTLTGIQKKFLKSRWLGQVLWMEQRAKKARNWHFRLRLTSIIGGIILPGLLTLSVNKAKEEPIAMWLYWSTFGISQIVAISAATEQLFTYGERWTHYRRSAESLKAQGWQFFELSGPYAAYENKGGHQAAFTLFVSQIEEVLQHDVEVYITQAMQTGEGEKSENSSTQSNPSYVTLEEKK